MIFGLDTKLFQEMGEGTFDANHHGDEVETVSIIVVNSDATTIEHANASVCSCNASNHEHHHHGEATTSNRQFINESTLVAALQTLSKEIIWRVKGFVRFPQSLHILNWAFGRFDLHPFEGSNEVTRHSEIVRLTIMGERGEVKKLARRFAEMIGGRVA